jgi:transcriptional regulator with XRE-family HTH domain
MEIKLRETLAQQMESKGFRRNHREVARRVHISPSALSQYLHGRSEPSLTTLARLAEFFDTSLDYLVFGIERPREVVDLGPVTRYVDMALADLQARTSERANLVGRIARVLAAQIDAAATAMSAEGIAMGGMISWNDLLVLERFSVQTDIVTLNLQKDIVTTPDGEGAAGRFLPVTAGNLSRGYRYRYLLPAAPFDWVEMVVRYRRMLVRAGASEEAVSQRCLFRATEGAAYVGMALYKLAVNELRAAEPLLYEQVSNSINAATQLGHVIPASDNLTADPLMDGLHLSMASKFFEQAWSQAKRL